jgi:hypothetical protein
MLYVGLYRSPSPRRRYQVMSGFSELPSPIILRRYFNTHICAFGRLQADAAPYCFVVLLLRLPLQHADNGSAG